MKKLRCRGKVTAAYSYTLHVTNECLVHHSRTREANCLLIFERHVVPFGVEGRWQLEVNPSQVLRGILLAVRATPHESVGP